MRRLPKPSLGLAILVAIVGLLAFYLALVDATRPHVGGDPIRFDRFLDLAELDRIEDAEILDADSYVVGTYTRDDGSTAEYNTPYLKTQNTRERLIDVLTENRVPLTIDQQFAKGLVGPASLVVPALIIALVLLYTFVSWQRGTGLFASGGGARRVPSGGLTASFEDVAGQDAAVAELREVSRYLAEPASFDATGAQVPKGILLYGPPGCGKTLVARALAGESGAAFYSISGSDFVELYVGVGAARVRDLFREARSNAPAIVFIDELDALGRRRGGGASGGAASGSSLEQEQSLNQILTEMDGFTASEGVIVVGATNRPDVLDPALLRPGRFDRAIGLERVDEEGREEILELHAEGKPLAADADLGAIAHGAVGMTGADLASLVNEAALLAAQADSKVITQENLDAALDRVKEEPERQRRLAMRGRTVGSGALAAEKVSFDDIAGVEEAIEELAEVRNFLADPGRFEALGARIPRGYLLTGPPGCGKTMLARAVAGESSAAFVSAAGPEFAEVFVGEGPARVRDLFAEASALAPAIVFIDEIDSIGARRGASAGDGHREREQTLNQILIELDGFTTRSGVIAMAATNRPDILDPALVRAGRFDRTISISLPDRRAREAILAVHAEGKRLASDVDLARIASLTRGFSGADLANVLNEATLLAARAGRKTVPMSLVEEGVQRVMTGISGGRVLSEDDKRRVAFHEAGHAVVARALPSVDLPHRVTIVPRGRSLGSTTRMELAERFTYSRETLMEEMAVLLAGRVAEQMAVGDAGSGGTDDLQRANEIARWMVCELAMSDLGLLTFQRGDNGEPRFSDASSEAVEAEVRKLLDEAKRTTEATLKRLRKPLAVVAETLLERETLNAEELDQLLGASQARR